VAELLDALIRIAGATAAGMGLVLLLSWARPGGKRRD